jgi:hypothetical protein
MLTILTVLGCYWWPWPLWEGIYLAFINNGYEYVCLGVEA